jgi:hypothetical protein
MTNPVNVRGQRTSWLERLSQPDIGLLASAVIDPPMQFADVSPDVPGNDQAAVSSVGA